MKMQSLLNIVKQETDGSAKLQTRDKRRWRALIIAVGVMMVIVMTITTMMLRVSGDRESFRDRLVKRSSNNINPGLKVLPIHSHNDYEREHPLYDALKLAIISVEADVWCFNEDDDALYVSHLPFFLSKSRTLKTLYTGPLEQLIDSVSQDGKVFGLFDTEPDQTLYLQIDVKNNGNVVFDKIQEHLKPLQDKGYITTYTPKDNKWYHGPLTVVLTGDSLLSRVASMEVRNVFADAKLDDLDSFKKRIEDLNNSEELNTISVVASCGLADVASSVGIFSSTDVEGFSDRGRRDVQRVIDKAHSFGLKTRIWETPNYPTEVRDLVWRDLISMGTDLLNVDDLTAASKMFNLRER